MRPRHVSLLPLALLVVLTACRGPARAPAPVSGPAPRASRRPLLPALQDPDPAVRRGAAATLGRLKSASREVIDALLYAQFDDDESVAAATVAALDRIQPDPAVALRVPLDTSFELVGEVMVRPASTTWQEIDCEPAALLDGEQLRACWRLVEIAPVYQTRIIQVQPIRFGWRNASEVRAEEKVRAREIAAVRAAPPPPDVPPMERVVPPAGEPEGAQPGEVWCRYESASGGTWRRRPECE